MNYLQKLFISMLLMSTILVASANSWFTAWMALEINMMSFLPIIVKNNKLSNESSMKYFFIQTMASMMILMVSVLNTVLYKEVSLELVWPYLINPLIPMALLMKMGAAPFHFWFPALMEGLPWNPAILLMTWQKLAPLSLNLLFLSSSKIILISILLSASIGALGGFNQTYLRKLLAYSSINHLSWLLLASLISENLMILYFSLYSSMIFSLALFLKMKNTLHLNQILYWKFSTLNKSMILFMSLLSLGGLPPLMGFFPKWLLLNFSLTFELLLVSLWMVLMSILTLYYYLRLIISTLIMDNSNPMYSSLEKSFLNLSFILFLNFSLMPLLILSS